MDDFEFDMNPWTEALGVWLHDHGLLIAVEPMNVSTDYGLGSDEVEYTLSPELLKLIIDTTGRTYSKDTDSFKFGWTKGYKQYPTGCELVAVFVLFQPGGIRVKMHIKTSNPAAGDAPGWTEFLTYQGAYSILWPTEAGHI